MNPKTEQLLATLEVITEGLLYSMAGDCSIDPFVWEIADRGEFNLVRTYATGTICVKRSPRQGGLLGGTIGGL